MRLGTERHGQAPRDRGAAPEGEACDVDEGIGCIKVKFNFEYSNDKYDWLNIE